MRDWVENLYYQNIFLVTTCLDILDYNIVVDKLLKLFYNSFVYFFINSNKFQINSLLISYKSILYKHFLLFKPQPLITIMIISHKKLLENRLIIELVYFIVYPLYAISCFISYIIPYFILYITLSYLLFVIKLKTIALSTWK